MQIRHGDVKLAAVRLEDHGVGRAAELQIGEQHVAFQIDHGNFFRVAGRNKRHRTIRQHHDLLRMFGHTHGAE